MFENGADDRRVLDAADDPHGAPAFWAEKGIDFVDFLNQARPVSPEGLFISRRFENAGDGIVVSRILPFPPGDITVKAVVSDHLLSLVGDVGTHGGQPFQRGKNLCGLPVFGRIDDLSLRIQVLHSFLGKRRPDDVAGEIFHGRFVIRRNTVSAKDIESRVPPPGEHFHHLLRYLTLIQQHPEHLVSKDGLQLFQLKRRSNAEHPFVAIEAAVGDEDVAVRIEAEEVSESLYGDNGAGDGIILRNCILEKYLQ